MTLSQVRTALAGSFDSVGVSRKDKCFVAKRGYFYHHGLTEEVVAKAVCIAIPTAKIVSTSDHWHAWPKDSFLEVRFTVETCWCGCGSDQHHQEATEEN